jgi:hypothetical protein
VPNFFYFVILFYFCSIIFLLSFTLVMTSDKDRIVLSLLTPRSGRVWRGEDRMSPIPCLSDLMVHHIIPISHKKKSRQDFIHVPKSYTFLDHWPME